MGQVTKMSGMDQKKMNEWNQEAGQIHGRIREYIDTHASTRIDVDFTTSLNPTQC